MNFGRGIFRSEKSVQNYRFQKQLWFHLVDMPSIHLKYLSILLSCHEFIYKFSCLSILSVCLSGCLSIEIYCRPLIRLPKFTQIPTKMRKTNFLFLFCITCIQTTRQHRLVTSMPQSKCHRGGWTSSDLHKHRWLPLRYPRYAHRTS